MKLKDIVQYYFDDNIEEWHNSNESVICDLHEYLGMTLGEYALWVESTYNIPFRFYFIGIFYYLRFYYFRLKK